MCKPPTAPLDRFQLSTASPVPPAAQLEEAIREAIRDGNLEPGTKLPPVRTLASHLGIAVNTAAKAYARLRDENLVEGRGRHGTFVASGDSPKMLAARQIVSEAQARLTELGVSQAAATQLLNEAYTASRDL